MFELDLLLSIFIYLKKSLKKKKKSTHEGHKCDISGVVRLVGWRHETRLWLF